MRQLASHELKAISAANYIEVIPPPLPGYRLIGWSEEIVRWETNRWYEYVGLLTIEHEIIMPIYRVQPIYEESDMVIYF